MSGDVVVKLYEYYSLTHSAEVLLMKKIMFGFASWFLWGATAHAGTCYEESNGTIYQVLSGPLSSCVQRSQSSPSSPYLYISSGGGITMKVFLLNGKILNLQ